MEHPRAWNPSRRKTVHSLPRRRRALTSAPKRMMPGADDFAAEAVEPNAVRRHSVVREVAAHYCLDPLPLLLHG